MKTITMLEYNTQAKGTRNRTSVASKLDAFLTANLEDFEAGKAYVIELSDVLEDKTITQAHYYTALKMLKANWSDKINYHFIMSDKHGNFKALNLAVK